MKAIILEKPGCISYRDVTATDVYMPTEEEMIEHGTNMYSLAEDRDPKEGEIVVEAVLGAVCTHEVSLYKGDLTHPRYPMIPGHEAVHRVIQVGPGVTHLKPGDYCACCWYMGQWSRRLVGPAKFAYKLPDTIKDPALWVIEPAASIVNAVSYMDLKPAQRVLLIGAGFMGLLMIQLIKGYPFSEFVVCDVKESSRKLAKQCGAQVVCAPDEVTGHFDRVIECSGTQSGLDLAVDACGVAGDIYLFGWHRFARTIDFKSQHTKGNRLIHTTPHLDCGREYSRYWPMTIRLFERGIFDLSPLISHRYDAEDICNAFADSVKREEGFVKSVIYFEDFEI